MDDSHVIRNRKRYHSIHFSGISRFTVVNRGQTVVKLSSLEPLLVWSSQIFSKTCMRHTVWLIRNDSSWNSLLTIKVSDKLSNLVKNPEHVREHTFYQANIFFIITSICSMSTTIWTVLRTWIFSCGLRTTLIYHCKHSISIPFLLKQYHSNIPAMRFSTSRPFGCCKQCCVQAAIISDTFKVHIIL